MEDHVWEKPLVNFIGLVDIFYVDQVYAHASSDEELERLISVGPPTLDTGSPIGAIFMDYQRHPPIPVNKELLEVRTLDVVEISASWYSKQLAAVPPGSVTVFMHHLEMMMLAYVDGMDVGKIPKHFLEPVLQTTSGTMVADLRRITRWKQLEVRKEGLQLKTIKGKEEMFGRMKTTSIWRLTLDLSLDEPYYPK